MTRSTKPTTAEIIAEGIAIDPQLVAQMDELTEVLSADWTDENVDDMLERMFKACGC